MTLFVDSKIDFPASDLEVPSHIEMATFALG